MREENFKRMSKHFKIKKNNQEITFFSSRDCLWETGEREGFPQVYSG